MVITSSQYFFINNQICRKQLVTFQFIAMGLLTLYEHCHRCYQCMWLVWRQMCLLDIIKYLNFIWAFHACGYSGFPLSFTIMGNWIHDWSVNLFWFPLYFFIKWLVVVINEYLKFFFFKFCYQEWISNIMFAFL
jgi:hypothetical protein